MKLSQLPSDALLWSTYTTMKIMAELKVPWEEAGKLPWRDKSRVKVGCRGFQGRIHVGGQKKALAKEAERGGGS